MSLALAHLSHYIVHECTVSTWALAEPSSVTNLSCNEVSLSTSSSRWLRYLDFACPFLYHVHPGVPEKRHRYHVFAGDTHFILVAVIRLSSGLANLESSWGQKEARGMWRGMKASIIVLSGIASESRCRICWHYTSQGEEASCCHFL